MNNSSSPLSLQTDRPLETWRVALLRILDAAFREHACPYMLIGASARDLLLFHVHGGPAPSRRTRDVDFAVAVDSWEKFEAVFNGLLRSDKFHRAPKMEHRLLYTAEEAYKTEVDIVPFGGVASAERTVAWPRDLGTVMNIAGFDEALSVALWISIADGLAVPVVSLPGLTILKLFAWMDRHQDRDATDLYRILRAYADAGNEDRLYESSLAEEFEFDLELAGANLLGADAAALCLPATRDKLLHTFTPDAIERLENQMLEPGLRWEEQARRAARLAEAFFASMLRADPESALS